MDDDDLKNWGCGCLCVILFFWFGVPTIRWGWNNISTFVDNVKADYNAKVARRVAEEKAAHQKKLAEERRLKEEAARQAEETARERARQDREARLRDFAAKEIPALLKVYQDLQGAIVEQNKRIVDLEKTLKTFEKEPRQDADYMRICSMRDEMVVARGSMHAKIEDAYIAYCKFKATPNRKDYDELYRKTLEDGIKAAEVAAKRFDEMRSMK